MFSLYACVSLTSLSLILSSNIFVQTTRSIGDHPLLEGWREKQKRASDEDNGKDQEKESGRSSGDRKEKKKKESKTEINADFDDPLSMMMRGEIQSVAPIRRETESRTQRKTEDGDAPNMMYQSPIMQEWEKRKKTILTECTLTGRIKVSKTDLTKIGSGDVDLKNSASLASTKERLRMLEKKVGVSESSGDCVSYSQDEYVANLNKTKNEITKAWNRNRRVLALKKCIMCTKMLADTRVPQFYPSMFVLVSGVLDAFCDLVRQRLTGRSKEFGKPLGRTFSPDEVAIEAKETCRNWFFKIACIRELMPRILVEASLIPNYRFLTNKEYLRVVSRLALCVRGIGDPMVALFTRVYIASMAHRVIPDNAQPILSMLDDYLFTCREFKMEKVRKLALDNGTTMGKYVKLHMYGVDQLLRFASAGIDAAASAAILKRYHKSCRNLIILATLLKHLDADYVSTNALKIVALIRDAPASSDKNGTQRTTEKALALCALAGRLCQNPPPSEQRLSVLNDAWKIVKTEKTFTVYTKCSRMYMELLAKFYSEREVRILLKDLVKHTHAANNAEEGIEAAAHKNLEGVIEVMMEYADKRGFGHLLTSQHFMEIVDTFKGGRKIMLCKMLLEKFASSQNDSTKRSDPVVIHTVFDLARYLHDSLDYLSAQSEREKIATLIANFVENIDFGRNLEQQLNVYVDCRAGFANLDKVNFRLVFCATRLAMKAHHIVRGRHTKKTAGFTKACLAFCHITIPTIASVFKRMRLFLHCGQVALVNQSVPQAETFFEECINLIPQCPDMVSDGKYGEKRTSEEFVSEICRHLASSLVVMPGHPVRGPLHLIQLFLTNVMDASCWQKGSGHRANLYVDVLGLIATMSQRKFPYHVGGVLSNDELYGSGNKKYVAQLDLYTNKLLDDVQSEIGETVQGDTMTEVGSNVTLRLLNQMIVSLDLTNARVLKLASNLYGLVRKKGKGPAFERLLQSTTRHVESRARRATVEKSEDSAALQQLARTMRA